MTSCHLYETRLKLMPVNNDASFKFVPGDAIYLDDSQVKKRILWHRWQCGLDRGLQLYRSLQSVIDIAE